MPDGWTRQALRVMCSSCSEDVVMGSLADSAKLAVIRDTVMAGKSSMVTMHESGLRIERI